MDPSSANDSAASASTEVASLQMLESMDLDKALCLLNMVAVSSASINPLPVAVCADE